MYAKCILLLLLCLVFTRSLIAKIRNGYLPDVTAARECLQQLNERLLTEPNMPDVERRRIHAAMRKHAQVIEHYELTQSLLHEFRLISPDMYEELDRLEDKRGRETDVYVRFIPEADAWVSLRGATFFQGSPVDIDASHSRFGKFTVAIDVWISSASLNLLAHEFGHTRYIVPNLAAYWEYYRKMYENIRSSSHMGHHSSDISGKMAHEFGQQYLRDRRLYKSRRGAPQSVYAIAKELRKKIRESVDTRFDELIASSHSFE